MNYFNIPEELRLLPQWMVAGKNGDREDKCPYNPKTGRKGSSTNSEDWGTFEQCEDLVENFGYSHLGFVFTSGDVYCCVDLDTYKTADARILSLHEEISVEARTYTEKSQSGSGTHVIGKGLIPDGATRALPHIEMYSHGRFMICTGNIIEPVQLVNDLQPIIDELCAKIRPSKASSHWHDLGPGEAREYEDSALIERIESFANGERFRDLYYDGDLSANNGDHSRADAALMQFLTKHTADNEQVYRIFMMSKLGQREKARRRQDYVLRTISDARKKLAQDEAHQLNVDALVEKMMKETVEAREVTQMAPAMTVATMRVLDDISLEENEHKESNITPPPGLIHDIATYCMGMAAYPNWEVAVSAAIAFMAGVCGRQYNCAGMGLNQYVIVMSRTGTGKDAAQECIGSLFTAVVAPSKFTVPAAMEFLGPSNIASGPALDKHMSTQPCCVMRLGEIGDTLEHWLDPRASNAEKAIVRTLLKLFHSSAKNQVAGGHIYSDKEKNVGMIFSPALTLHGETVAHKIFDVASEDLVKGGFLSRFLFLENTQPRPMASKNMIKEPPIALVEKAASLISYVLSLRQQTKVILVEMDSKAAAILCSYQENIDKGIRSKGEDDPWVELANRAHVKAVRLAAKAAISSNHITPMISAEHALWGIEVVEHGLKIFTTRFKRGDVGQGDSKLHFDVITIIKRYFKKGDKYMEEGSPAYKDFHAAGLIPLRFLRDFTKGLAAFRKHKLGATKALDLTLESLVKDGMLVQFSKDKALKQFGTTALVYSLGKEWR